MIGYRQHQQGDIQIYVHTREIAQLSDEPVHGLYKNIENRVMPLELMVGEEGNPTKITENANEITIRIRPAVYERLLEQGTASDWTFLYKIRLSLPPDNSFYRILESIVAGFDRRTSRRTDRS